VAAWEWQLMHKRFTWFCTSIRAFVEPCGEWQIAWAFDQKPERADLAAWINQSDPLSLYIRKLVETGSLDRAQVEATDKRVREEIAGAARFALDSPYPVPADAYRHVYAMGERG